MHATFFGVKRWHLRIVEASKRLLQPDGLTPARFDLMRAIAARGGELVQRNLQYLFGVSAVTISKMVKGLAEKGFVVRTRHTRDRRFKNVIITASGYAALNADLKYCVDSRINEVLAAALVTGERYANIDSAVVRRRIEKMNDRLVYGRRILRDRSNVRHPWSRGDFASLGMFSLHHEENPHPLRRRRRPTDAGAPLPWEIAPPARRPRIGKAPRARRPRTETLHILEESFEGFERPVDNDARRTATDGDERVPDLGSERDDEGGERAVDEGRERDDEGGERGGGERFDDRSLLAEMAKAAEAVEAEDREIVARARAALGIGVTGG